jgi:hypothetical protein
MCAHRWIEITTDSEEAAGLRRFLCICDGCDFELTDPTTN